MAGSASGAIREYREGGCGHGGWAAAHQLYDNLDDIELLPLTIRLLPPLIDYALQTAAIFYLLFFHVLLLLLVAFLLHVFTE